MILFNDPVLGRDAGDGARTPIEPSLDLASLIRPGRRLMSFAFLPLYTGDYRRDTAHLDCAEHGIYLLFLMHCWDQKGPLPIDERKLLGICGARSGSEIEAMRRVLVEFFVRMEDGWYNTRMQREVEAADAVSRARSVAGKRGYVAKLRKIKEQILSSKSLARVKQVPITPTPTPILPPSPSLERSKALASADESASASEPVFVVAKIPTSKGTEFPIDRRYVEELEAAYPKVDGPQTLREIRAWCLSNPKDCWTERGVLRGINRWFEREQNKFRRS